MADNLIFPIGFDLEKAVNEASKEWDSKYAGKLEKMLAKRPISVKFGFNTAKLDDLDDVRRRLAELKIEPITPENRAALKELVRELKELARIMEKVSNLRGIELPELQAAKAAKMRKEIEQADEKLRLSQERVRQAQERLTLSPKERNNKPTNKRCLSFTGWIYLAPYCGAAASLLIGCVVFLIQAKLCRWWLSVHRQESLEYVWHKWTWIGTDK